MVPNKLTAYPCTFPVKVLADLLEQKSQTSIRRAMKLNDSDRIGRTLKDKGVTISDVEHDLSEKFVYFYLETLATHTIQRWRNPIASRLLADINTMGFDQWQLQKIGGYIFQPNKSINQTLGRHSESIAQHTDQLSVQKGEIERLKILVTALTKQAHSIDSNDKNHIPNSNLKPLEPSKIEVYGDDSNSDICNTILSMRQFLPENLTILLEHIAGIVDPQTVEKLGLPQSDLSRKMKVSEVRNFLLNNMTIHCTDIENTLLNDELPERLEFCVEVMGNRTIKADDKMSRVYMMGTCTSTVKSDSLPPDTKVIDPLSQDAYLFASQQPR